LAHVAELTRLPTRHLRRLTLSGSGWAEKPCWWSMRQVLPDRCFPHLAHEYQPVVCFCWACLQEDSELGRPEYLRSSWLLAVPTICPRHGMSLQDTCAHCGSMQLPIAVQIGTSSRMACARCLGLLGMRPERRTLLPAGFMSLVKFERQVFHQLRRSSIDASLLLCVEDLLWLLSRPLVEGGKLAVHALPDTVFRLPQHIYRLPREKPWLGGFAVEVRRGLLAHLACLLQEQNALERLLSESSRNYSLQLLLRVVTKADADYWVSSDH
jgi:hypothetical protein